MATIEIKNLGPVKEAKFDLNKVNVFMGPQSSGKSTIAKVISFCTWLDKKFSRDSFTKDVSDAIQGEKGHNYIKELKTYHRLTEGFFSENTSIGFDGEEIVFSYNCDFSYNGSYVVGMEDQNEKYSIKFKSGKRRTSNKVIYIPSERNFVSAIYNLNEYLRDKDLIQDFVYNWYEAKRKYPQNHKLNILNLDVQYYNESEDVDRLTLGNGKELLLQVASSGLQAVVPLITTFDYIANGIYNESRPMSVAERDKIIKQYDEIGQNPDINREYLDTLFSILVSKNYTHSQFIIEEPEQNLFPTTQRDLIYYMMRVLNESERDHRLTFTTHSPYILYALNNCMMGSLVYDKMSDNDKGRLKCDKALIDPEKVSIYQIEDGTLRKIQDEDGLIGSNYFDDKMKELMDDFYVMLNYYGK